MPCNLEPDNLLALREHEVEEHATTVDREALSEKPAIGEMAGEKIV
jgi:hypothetical protein